MHLGNIERHVSDWSQAIERTDRRLQSSQYATAYTGQSAYFQRREGAITAEAEIKTCLESVA